MSCETVVRYVKGFANGLIDLTFPQTPRIAFVSTVVGSYTWHYIETYATSMYRWTLIRTAEKTAFFGLGNLLGDSWARGIGEFAIDWIALPLATPHVRPQTAVQVSFLASLVTCIVLNQVSAGFTRMQKQKSQETLAKLLDNNSDTQQAK